MKEKKYSLFESVFYKLNILLLAFGVAKSS